MNEIIKSAWKDILQLLKTEAVSLTSSYKNEVLTYTSRKIERLTFLNKNKEALGNDFYNQKMEEEKVHDQVFINMLKIAAKAKDQKLINMCFDIINAAIDKAIQLAIA